jgi:AcrR family transcriptional regulator
MGAAAKTQGAVVAGAQREPGAQMRRGAVTAGLGMGVVGRGAGRAQISEIQRSRLLTAAVSTVDERGYAGATVAHITRRARISRRTFYELFANREDCLAAVVEDAVRRVWAELPVAGMELLAWRERLRVGLGTILSFFDREPALARVCVVQSARGGPLMLERREEILEALAATIEEGRSEGVRGVECSPLTAEGLVGAALAIVHARLARGQREPLAGLLNELMGMIVLPYLGTAAARREQTRPVPQARVVRRPVGSGRPPGDPLEGLQMRMTYRTARVLEGIAEHPGASNRVVSEYAGIQDQGQVSKLLARLQRLGLLTNTGHGRTKGEPNAWTLTLRGEQVAQGIRRHVDTEQRAA